MALGKAAGVDSRRILPYCVPDYVNSRATL
jgi:hypothetical protein